MSSTFIEDNVVILAKGAVADGTSETLTSVIDMEGFDELTYVVNFGDVDAAAVLTLQPKENTASSTSSPTPTAVDVSSATLSGTVTPVITTGAVVITEDSGNLDNKSVVVNVQRNSLSKRYHFLSITATVESYEIVSITAIKSKARSLPVTQDSGNVVVATQFA